MLKAIRKAHGAGWRAGMNIHHEFNYHADGTKTIKQPVCPYTKRRHFILALIWEGARLEGSLESTKTWLKERNSL